MNTKHRDPVDHFGTTNQHAGESLIDLYCWPGLFSIAPGVSSLIGCLASLAYNHREYTLTTAVVGVLALVFGVLWIVIEQRLVRRIEEPWLTEHPVA
jgi:hypothetical protein